MQLPAQSDHVRLLASEAMRPWWPVTPIKEVSTGRCWRTFNIDDRIALHMHHSRQVSQCSWNSPWSERRIAAAAAAFSSHGLASPHIARGESSSGVHYFIDQWLNGTRVGIVGDFFNGKHDPSGRDLEAIAALLARVHSVPTGWYEPWRRQLIKKHSALRTAAHGSPLWWYGAARHYFRGLSDDALADWVTACERHAPMPRTSRLATRVVTSHGDFQPSNLLRVASATSARSEHESEYKLIDLEFACVTSAAVDIGLALSFVRGLTARRHFARAYIRHARAGGRRAPVEVLAADAIDSDEVDELIADAAHHHTLHWPGGQASGLLYAEVKRMRDRQMTSLARTCYDAYAATADDALKAGSSTGSSSSSLRDTALVAGLSHRAMLTAGFHRNRSDPCFRRCFRDWCYQGT